VGICLVRNLPTGGRWTWRNRIRLIRARRIFKANIIAHVIQAILIPLGTDLMGTIDPKCLEQSGSYVSIYEWACRLIVTQSSLFLFIGICMCFLPCCYIIGDVPEVTGVPLDVVLRLRREAQVLQEQGSCAICQDTWQNEPVVALPCSHLFHMKCIDGWIDEHPNCPVCREEIR
jgi:hypothetical protein